MDQNHRQREDQDKWREEMLQGFGRPDDTNDGSVTDEQLSQIAGAAGRVR
jgi:hypothetical protein